MHIQDNAMCVCGMSVPARDDGEGKERRHADTQSVVFTLLRAMIVCDSNIPLF